MARDLSAGNNLWANQVVVSSYPFTLACRFQPDTVTGFQSLLGIWNASIEEEGHFIGLDGNEARAASVNTTTSRFAYASNTLSIGTWYTIIGRFNSDTDIECIVDANFGSKGSDLVTSVTFGTPNVTYFGAVPYGASAQADGKGADPAVWAFTLPDEQVTGFAKGYQPELLRRDNLFDHWPLWGNSSPEPSAKGSQGLAMELIGAPNKFEHPLVISPKRPILTVSNQVNLGGNLFQRRFSTYGYERGY